MQTSAPANDNSKRSVLPPSLTPRGINRVQAAEYVGVSASLFDEGVKDGTFPKPRRYKGRVIWDVRQLDEAFSELPGEETKNPWHEALNS